MAKDKKQPDAKPPDVRRLGFLRGQFKVPDDFNTMFRKEIEEMFYGPDPEAGATKRDPRNDS